MDTRSKGRSQADAVTPSRREINSTSCTKSIITLAPASSTFLSTLNPPMGDLVKLPDPFANGCGDRLFIVFPSKSPSESSSSSRRQHEIFQLSSIQRQKSALSSFFVNNPSWVCSNGNLHIMNPMDPLFFVLPLFSAIEGTNTESWQPLGQIVSKISQIIQNAIDPSQLPNFFDCYNNDDLILYKFQRKRALQWLSSKLEKVISVLTKQYVEKKRREEREESSSTQVHKSQKIQDGAFSSTFRLDESSILSIQLPEITTANNNSDYPPSTISSSLLQEEEERFVYISAIQIVCHNLSSTWRNAFLTFLNNNSTSSSTNDILTEETLWSIPTITSMTTDNNTLSGQKRTHESINASRMDDEKNNTYINVSNANMTHTTTMSTTSTNMTADGKKNSILPIKGKISTTTTTNNTSQGLKQLSKVNTKGMKKMDSFFTQKLNPNDDKK